MEQNTIETGKGQDMGVTMAFCFEQESGRAIFLPSTL
jgi:hypothetical protein